MPSGRSAVHEMRLHAADPFLVEIRDPVQSGVTVRVPLDRRDGRAASRLAPVPCRPKPGETPGLRPASR
ncbi:hypothetical protein [Streptomyces sp. NRRL F-2664]|uniref:hypothetical protein n=1 Tax=Streptomyces sp. NRRL F-2664 TaxID=1463842 RepID=UPI00131DC5AD|nr:hypothetical protein [Streptomyces sp. NRRL F-2664]